MEDPRGSFINSRDPRGSSTEGNIPSFRGMFDTPHLGIWIFDNTICIAYQGILDKWFLNMGMRDEWNPWHDSTNGIFPLSWTHTISVRCNDILVYAWFWSTFLPIFSILWWSKQYSLESTSSASQCQLTQVKQRRRIAPPVLLPVLRQRLREVRHAFIQHVSAAVTKGGPSLSPRRSTSLIRAAIKALSLTGWNVGKV